MSQHTTEEQFDRATLTAELLTIVTAVWYDVDHNGGAGVSAFFTPDGELWFGTRCLTGTAEIDAGYAGRAARGPRTSRHLVTNMHLTTIGPAEVSAVSNLVLFAEDGEPPRTAVTPAMVSDVIDEFERHDGSWKIRSRRFEALFVPQGLELAVPTS